MSLKYTKLDEELGFLKKWEKLIDKIFHEAGAADWRPYVMVPNEPDETGERFGQHIDNFWFKPTDEVWDRKTIRKMHKIMWEKGIDPEPWEMARAKAHDFVEAIVSAIEWAEENGTLGTPLKEPFKRKHVRYIDYGIGASLGEIDEPDYNKYKAVLNRMREITAKAKEESGYLDTLENQRAVILKAERYLVKLKEEIPVEIFEQKLVLRQIFARDLARKRALLATLAKVETVYKKWLEEYFKVSKTIGHDYREMVLIKKIIAAAERAKREIQQMIDRVEELLKGL